MEPGVKFQVVFRDIIFRHIALVYKRDGRKSMNPGNCHMLAVSSQWSDISCQRLFRYTPGALDYPTPLRFGDP
jgi:transposase